VVYVLCLIEIVARKVRRAALRGAQVESWLGNGAFSMVYSGLYSIAVPKIERQRHACVILSVSDRNSRSESSSHCSVKSSSRGRAGQRCAFN